MNSNAPETSPQSIIFDADPAARLRELTRTAMTSLDNRAAVIGLFRRVIEEASSGNAAMTEAQARIQLGNLLAMTPQEAGEGMKQYDAAVEILKPLIDAGDDDAKAELAGARANQAQLLQRVSGGQGLMTAQAAINEAIELMSQTKWRSTPRYAHVLAAFYIHKGSILASLRRGPEALGAFEMTVEISLLLEDLGDPRWRDVCGGAWLNRGMVLAGMGSGDSGVQALICFEAAISAMTPKEGSGSSPALAAALTNRANILAYATAEIPAAKAAMEDAVRALKIVNGQERGNKGASETALKAIWALCGGANKVLSIVPGRRYQSPLAHQVSDYVDEAIALLKHWEELRAPFPVAMATEFFRYGARLYCWMDPNFFIEFVHDLLPDGSPPTARFAPACIPIAIQVLDDRLPDLEGNHWVIDGDVRSQRLLRDHERLLEERQRLVALAEQYGVTLTETQTGTSS